MQTNVNVRDLENLPRGKIKRAATGGAAGHPVSAQEEQMRHTEAVLPTILAVIMAVMLTAAPAVAQPITGVPVSPDATETIDGRYLPARPTPFRGEINLNAYQSKPFWPARIVPPKGAPNVLLIMTDDVGFGAPSTFGGVIPTPALDRIANMGLRYTQFHSTALCSPTRAALITGCNHHSVGFGVISEMSTGYSGYDSIIGPESATIGRILKDNGVVF
jgi:arylsulfatase